MLVVYDNNGTVYFAGTGYPTPVGIPYLEFDVPEGKYFKGIDVSVDPPEPIFEDIPKSEIEKMKEEIELLKGSVMEISKEVYA